MDERGPGKGMRYDAEWLMECLLMKIKSNERSPRAYKTFYAQIICYPSPALILSVDSSALCHVISVLMKRLYSQSSGSYRTNICILGKDQLYGTRCP